MALFCGSRSFSHVDEDLGSPPTPKKKQNGNHNKNPYSDRGLDKFSAVLAELDARKEKIMARPGARDVSMVKFMYDDSRDWVPIIVKLRDEKQEPVKTKQAPAPTPAHDELEEKKEAKEAAKQEPAASEKKKAVMKKSLAETWWRCNCKPCCYWPVVMVLILLCLVMFGRVFAICCTSIWWYLVPIVQDRCSGNANNNRRRSIKKDYGRRLSDKRIHAGVNSPPRASSPKHHGKKGLF